MRITYNLIAGALIHDRAAIAKGPGQGACVVTILGVEQALTVPGRSIGILLVVLFRP